MKDHGFKKFFKFLFSAYILGLVHIITIPAMLFGLFMGLLLKEEKKAQMWNRLAKICLRILFKLSFFRIKMEGEMNIPPTPVVFALNHLSHLDGIIFEVILNRRLFAITEPLARFPFVIRFWVKHMGFVDVLRDKNDIRGYREGHSGHEAIELSIKKIGSGESMLIFPEGHFERNRGLLHFHTGVTRIALNAKVPLIPVSIYGTEKILPPDHWLFWPGSIRLIFHKPMYLNKYYKFKDNHKLIKNLTKKIKKSISVSLPKRLVSS